jgi:hypothetical protein
VGTGTYELGFSSNNGVTWNPISTGVFMEALDVEVVYSIANSTTREAPIRKSKKRADEFRRQDFYKEYT